MSSIVRILLAITLVASLCGGGAWWWLHKQWDKPIVEQTMTIDIPRGMATVQIGKLFQEKGLLEYHWLFPLWIRYANLSPKSGEYLLNKGESLIEIAQTLHQGVPLLHSVTIPEGAPWRDIRKIINENELIDIKIFESLLKEYITAQSALDTFEGSIPPETYLFAKGQSEREIVAQIKRHMSQILALFESPQAARQGLILASIIEKEAGNAEEMATIASVFYNRLKRGMRLQSDPTVIYGMGNYYTGQLLRVHLQVDTPFNTYTRHGLPPTPICSASKMAIDAVLNPAKSPYFYFVANGKGGHAFSVTLAEHNRNVSKYRAWLRSQQ